MGTLAIKTDMIKKQKISDEIIYIHWKQKIAGFFKTLPDAD